MQSHVPSVLLGMEWSYRSDLDYICHDRCPERIGPDWHEVGELPYFCVDCGQELAPHYEFVVRIEQSERTRWRYRFTGGATFGMYFTPGFYWPAYIYSPTIISAGIPAGGEFYRIMNWRYGNTR